MRKQKRVSLHFGLLELGDAIAGARLLAETLKADGFSRPDEDQRAAPGAIGAILILTELHIENLLRAMRKEIDPRATWTTGNAAPESMGDWLDLQLPAWSSVSHPAKPPTTDKKVAQLPRRRSRRRTLAK